MSEGFAWWAGSTSEWFSIGPCATREQAIAEGSAMWCGDPFHIIEAQRPTVRFMADQLIDDQYFEVDDYFSGDHGEAERFGPPDVIKEADEELQKLLDDWCDRYHGTFVQPELFSGTRNAELISSNGGEA